PGESRCNGKWHPVCRYMSDVAGVPALEVVYLSMSESVRELIKQYQAFCEVAPYYVVFEERSSNGAITKQRIQAGLDIDVYGVKSGLGPGPLSDYALGCAALREVAQTVTSQTGDSCSIEVIPFASTVILDTRRHFQPQGMIRIRITRGRGIGQPAGEPEEKVLKAILTQLNDLGISSGNSRT
ncbi:MAG TPA: hypothetical protein VLE22_18030, partial [Bryobacteraceae bacterium]|nr:hypothetical protein [Bryobacteraceae bacterium]